MASEIQNEQHDQFRNYVVLLNGASSSGKSSIARELQSIMSETWLRASVDLFGEMLPRALDAEEFARFLSGVHRAIAELARAGFPVILDHVMAEREWLDELVRLFAGTPVLFVGVRAPLDVLEARERNRGDRQSGLAREQFDVVHRHCHYDLELDTSVLNAVQCAQEIKDRLALGSGTGFETMRAETAKAPFPGP